MRRVAGYLFGFMKQQAPKGVDRAVTDGRLTHVHVEPVRRRDRADHRDRRRDPRLPRRGRDPAAAAGARLRHRRPVAAARGPAARSAAASAMPQGGLTDEQQAAGPALALDALDPVPRRRLRSRRRRRRTTTCCGSWSTRSAAPTWPPYLPLLEEELALPGRGPPGARLARRRDRARRRLPRRDRRRRHVGPARRAPAAAGRRRRSSILEKNDDVGGTWFENTYPGCRVDNPNHNYSYSFAQRHDWPFHFSTQDVLLDYFRRCADAFGLREHIRFGTEVAVGRRGPTHDRAGRVRVRTAGRHARRRSRPTPSSARSASSTGRRCRTSPGASRFDGPVVPLGPLGPLGRPRRQARRGDRHRRERGAVHPRDRAGGRRAARVPAHAAVVRARRPTTTTRSRRACAGSTATCRRTASGTASGSSGGWATARSTAVRVDEAWEPKGEAGQRGERLRAHGAHRRTSSAEFADRPDLLEKVVPDLPAGREAHAARQRRLGRARSSATTCGSSPTPIREITPNGRRHRRRRGARRST